MWEDPEVTVGTQEYVSVMAQTIAGCIVVSIIFLTIGRMRKTQK